MTTINQKLINDLISVVIDKKTDITHIMDLITLLMQEVEKYKGLTGEQKKQYVIETLFQIAYGRDGLPYTNDDLLPKTILEPLVFLEKNNILPYMIDTIISASKGIYNINTIKSFFSKCF